MNPEPGPGNTPAEAAIYRAESLRPGMSIEVPLSHGERITMRLLRSTGRAHEGGLKAELFVTPDEDALIVSATRGRGLSVALVGPKNTVAPLKARLDDIALIVLGTSLHVTRPDPKSVTIHAGEPT